MEFEFQKTQEMWRAQATVDAQKNCESRYQQGRGPCNIFILDTSSSIGEEGFRQMKSTFSLILDEYANYPDIDENVTVIVCGRITRYHYHYSNNYLDIKRSLDSIEYGGLSPLAGAFFLSFGAMRNGAGHTARIGDLHIRPRVILFSDGKPTDFTLTSDADDSPFHERDKEKHFLLQMAKDIGKTHPIFCIPIGNNPDLKSYQAKCRKAFSSYDENIVSDNKSIKKLFTLQVVKDRKCDSGGISPLTKDRIHRSDPKEKAEILNDQYLLFSRKKAVPSNINKLESVQRRICAGRLLDYQQFQTYHSAAGKGITTTKQTSRKSSVDSFLEVFSAFSSGGKVVYPHEARQLGKYTKNMRAVALISMKNGDFDKETVVTLLASASSDIFTEKDKDDIFDICTKRSAYVSLEEINEEDDDDENEKDYYHERNPLLPCLGTRVKRGPDWHWGNQDSQGPGTVIGHLKDGRLIIEWDTGVKNYYHYDIHMSMYEVSVCSEPRILDTEIIAPGCLVTRGPDWEWGDQDGGEGSIGSVYRVRKNGRVHVRWSNGEKGDYRYGQYGKFDIFLCDPFSSDEIQIHENQMRTTVLDNQPDITTPEKDSLKIEKKRATPTFENTSTSSFHLKTIKGKYFKNDRVTDSLSDLEVDGLNETALPTDQWMWRDSSGEWIPYSRKINKRINECFKRQSKSTVIVSLYGTDYRVVMAKRIQINLESRETTDIKLIKNE
ncbi:uncharacterized protein LOC133203079 [Saccostrea echinata]|uniref:uncharacterized protein LOC133203079 n=1 Tax=Saccostrea echinata TaxID=191078 RepID=UPI002A82A7D6|nr:uncharacterized protein LOC133203079 [Saccostrea echinata]